MSDNYYFKSPFITFLLESKFQNIQVGVFHRRSSNGCLGKSSIPYSSSLTSMARRISDFYEISQRIKKTSSAKRKRQSLQKQSSDYRSDCMKLFDIARCRCPFDHLQLPSNRSSSHSRTLILAWSKRQTTNVHRSYRSQVYYKMSKIVCESINKNLLATICN